MKFSLPGIFMVTMLALTSASSADSSVFEFSVDKPVRDVYDNLYSSLEEARLYVVFEPNIGQNLASFAKRWGDDYNKNGLTAIRTMVFCNAWYANQVSNQDPRMLAFCPLHLTLVEKDGRTTALFTRPTTFAADSPAQATLAELEETVIDAIKRGMTR